MRTYLCGPMRHRVLFNFPAFDAAATDLRAQGWHVISPADLDRAAGFDLEALLSCEAIHLLPGWEASKGANAELAVAHWIGLKVFDYEPLETGVT